MTKEEQVTYLNQIRPFINLQAVCKDYNEKSTNTIDYNNLRTVLKDYSSTRLSTEKLSSLIDYLYRHLYPIVFEVNNKTRLIKKSVIYDIASVHTKNMVDDIVKEIESDFYNK